MRSMRWLSLVLICSATLPARADSPRPRPARSSSIAGRLDPLAGLAAAERRKLYHGESVEHPKAFRWGGGHYFGGVAYHLVRATPDDVLSAMTRPADLLELLPSTRAARRVKSGDGRDAIELESGEPIMNATYSVRFRRVSPTELEFWLDPTRPRGIRDVYGWVRVRPIDEARSLVAVGVALDVGSELVRLVFGADIQQTILSTPGQISDVFERRARARMATRRDR